MTTPARAPRRIVLLEADRNSPVAQVLGEYTGEEISGRRLHEDLQRFAAEYPKRIIAAEWLGPLGWTRFLWTGPRADQEGVTNRAATS